MSDEDPELARAIREAAGDAHLLAKMNQIERRLEHLQSQLERVLFNQGKLAGAEPGVSEQGAPPLISRPKLPIFKRMQLVVNSVLLCILSTLQEERPDLKIFPEFKMNEGTLANMVKCCMEANIPGTLLPAQDQSDAWNALSSADSDSVPRLLQNLDPTKNAYLKELLRRLSNCRNNFPATWRVPLACFSHLTPGGSQELAEDGRLSLCKDFVDSAATHVVSKEMADMKPTGFKESMIKSLEKLRVVAASKAAQTPA